MDCFHALIARGGMFFSRLSRLTSPAGFGGGSASRLFAGRPGFSACFIGARGGVGCTTLAAEFAAAGAVSGMRTTAVDADSGRGNLHYRLDVPLSRDTFTLRDLAPVLDDVDGDLLERVLSPSASGVMLLPRSPGAPPCPAPTCPAPPDARFAGVPQALSACFDLVVVDAGCAPAGLGLCLEGGFDVVVLVAVPELSGVASAKAALDFLKGRTAASQVLVLNRSLGAADSVSAADVRTYTGQRPALVLPEDTEACRRAGDEGALLFNGKSALGRSLRRMPEVVLPAARRGGA